MSAALENKENLKLISLKNNLINDEGCKIICNSLKNKTALQCISLANNNITNDSC